MTAMIKTLLSAYPPHLVSRIDDELNCIGRARGIL